MATLTKRDSSPYFYARFQMDGKDRWISTKETNRKEAEKALKRIVAQARGDMAIDEQAKILTDLIEALPDDLQTKKREEVVRTILRAQRNKVALEQAWTQWNSNSNKEYEPKEKTILGYQAIWRRFTAWAGHREIAFLHEVDVLAHLNLLDQNRPSNAAILLFGKQPQRFFLTSEVKCLHFHGTEVRKPIPSYQVYKGTLFELVDQAVDFVMSKVDRAVGTRAQGPQAPVEYELPRDAVAEAIVNAIAHRDYTPPFGLSR